MWEREWKCLFVYVYVGDRLLGQAPSRPTRPPSAKETCPTSHPLGNSCLSSHSFDCSRGQNVILNHSSHTDLGNQGFSSWNHAFSERLKQYLRLQHELVVWALINVCSSSSSATFSVFPYPPIKTGRTQWNVKLSYLFISACLPCVWILYY